MAASFRNSRFIENAGEKFRENIKCQTVKHVCGGDELLHFHYCLIIFDENSFEWGSLNNLSV